MTASSYAPIREGDNNYFELEEAVPDTITNGCFSHCFCCFGWGRKEKKKKNQESSSNNNYLLRNHHQQNQNGEINRELDYGDEDSWVVKRLEKLKELSEVVAGPKWKNLIRKVGKYFKPNKSRTQPMCTYTPQSYALNFDDGNCGVEEDDGDFLFPKFSSTFTVPPPPQQQKIPT